MKDIFGRQRGGTRLAATSCMNDEDTTTPLRKPSLRNIKYSLLAVWLEVAFVVIVFFLLPMLLSLTQPGCDGCDLVRLLTWSADRGLRIGLTFIFAFLLYFWFIIIPLAAVPPVIGLVIDYYRLEHEERERSARDEDGREA